MRSYFVCHKVKSKVWVVAELRADFGCLSVAINAAAMHGFKQSDYIVRDVGVFDQKNCAGRSADCQVIDVDLKALEAYRANNAYDIVKKMCAVAGKDPVAYMKDIYPDYAAVLSL